MNIFYFYMEISKQVILNKINYRLVVSFKVGA